MLISKLILGLLSLVFFLLQFSPKLSDISKIMINLSALCALMAALTDPISMYIVNSKSSFSFPSLSTYVAHNERLILTNYSDSTVSYSIVPTVNDSSYVAEKNVVGEIAPRNNITIKTSEIVTVKGSSQFSALVNISAPTSLVDALVSRVNLDTGLVETIHPNNK